MADEKSKMELIKKWLETCSLLNNGKIKVDYLNDDLNSYSIDRTPVTPIYRSYSDGSKLKQIAFDFTIQAPISSQAIVNLTNSKFCEDFMDWVESKNKKRELPKVPGAQSITCTSPGYILQKTQTQAIYIIQMNFKYFEKF